METTTQAPVKLTPSAIAEIKRLMTQDANNQYLRMGTKGGGCSGLTYILDFDALADDDTQYNIDGIPVIMKDAHAIYLFGITVDYEQGLSNRGFTFNNPNASSTCGCGTSFSV
jgi:iron-sulfur cluster assembly accessory protein